jgi:hypothetical protein
VKKGLQILETMISKRLNQQNQMEIESSDFSKKTKLPDNDPIITALVNQDLITSLSELEGHKNTDISYLSTKILDALNIE